MSEYKHLMTNKDKDVFIPLVPSILGAMLMSKVSRQKEGFREDLIKMVNEDMINLPKEATHELFKSSYVVANGFMEKWGVNYGHSSIKELDTLQMCFENKSRWFTEVLETVKPSKFMSYIEYSLRYNPPKSYYIPKELDKYPEIKEDYISFCDFCFAVYKEINDDFVELFENRYPELSPRELKLKAFENARNVLPLSTHANMGMQTNLRAFCDTLAELMSYEDLNNEVYQTALAMKEEAEKVSVGMVKHTEKTPYLVSYVKSFYDSVDIPKERYEHDNVSVQIDDEFVGNLDLITRYGDLSKMDRFDELPAVFKTIGRWLRVNMTEACHHQFLRHRAFNYRPYMPNVDFGYICPVEIRKTDNQEIQGRIRSKIAGIYESSCEIYDELVKAGLKYLAPYVVINCNIRRTDFFADFAGLSHFLTLRKEAHAQDEIREIAEIIDQQFAEDQAKFKGLKFDKN